MEDGVDSPLLERAWNLMTQFVELGTRERNGGLTPSDKRKLQSVRRDLALTQKCINIEDALRSGTGMLAPAPSHTIVAASSATQHSKPHTIIDLTSEVNTKFEENESVICSGLSQENPEMVRRDSLAASIDANGTFTSHSPDRQGSAPGSMKRRRSSSDVRSIDTSVISSSHASEISSHFDGSVEVPARGLGLRHRASRHHIASVDKSGAQTPMFAPAALGNDITWSGYRKTWYYCDSVPCIIFGSHNGKYFILPPCQGCADTQSQKGFFKGVKGLQLHLSHCSRIKDGSSALQMHLRLLREITLEEVRQYLLEPGLIYLRSAAEAGPKIVPSSSCLSEIEATSEGANDV